MGFGAALAPASTTTGHTWEGIWRPSAIPPSGSPGDGRNEAQCHALGVGETSRLEELPSLDQERLPRDNSKHRRTVPSSSIVARSLNSRRPAPGTAVRTGLQPPDPGKHRRLAPRMRFATDYGGLAETWHRRGEIDRRHSNPKGKFTSGFLSIQVQITRRQAAAFSANPCNAVN